MDDDKQQSRGAVWFKLRGSFANLSMQTKLLVVFLFLVTLPITAVSFLSFRDYSQSFEKNTTEYAVEMTAKTLQGLDDYIEDLFNLSSMPLYNADFLHLLNDPDTGLAKLKSMELFIMNLNRVKQDTASVYVFDNFGHMFYNVKSRGTRNNIDEMLPIWSDLAKKSNGRPVLVSTREVTTDYSKPYYAFTVIRGLKELDFLKPIGFIAFDTNISAIKDSILSMDAVTQGKTILLDENDRVVFDSDLKLITRDLSDDPAVRLATQKRGDFLIDRDGTTYLCAYSVSELTRWKMLVYIPLEDVMRQTTTTRNVTLWTTIAIILVALSASIGIAFALTSPLRKIKMLMREVQRGKLNVRFKVKHLDEVGSLGRHFNIMLQRVQDLLEEVAVTQARKREAEFNVLQSQINPHFIYNTLETIRMTAETNDDEEVAEMTYTLGKLLRYGINRGNEIVSVQDEMNHLRDYVSLQNYRFANRFVLEIRIPEHLLLCKCIKLIFQPIVENAINHAYRQTTGAGTIIIDAIEEGEWLHFRVQDNGAGMDNETMRTMDELLAGTRRLESGRGIGLQNVNERIKIHYGSTYGLHVESTPGQGTTVTLTLSANGGATC